MDSPASHWKTHQPIFIIALLLLACVAAIGAAYAAQDSPASYWPAEGDALDAAGGNDGTLVGGTGYETGISGTAFRFEHIGDAVVVPSDPSLDLEIMPAASFEGWVKVLGNPSLTGDMVIVAKHECGFANGWFFLTRSGGYIAGNYAGGFGTGGVDLADGQFHHFAVVKDGATYREYIDGVLTGETTSPPVGAYVPGSTMFIGSMIAGGSPFDPCYAAKHQLNGLVDEVKVHHRALSGGEIRQTFLQANRGAGSGNRACEASNGAVGEHADGKTDAVNCVTPTPPGGGDDGGGGGV